MTRIKNKFCFFVCFLMLTLGTGCATNRGVIDLQIAQPVNPAQGASVKIIRVTDHRVFQKAPRSPAIPSLRGNHIDDKALTLRAIARKRNGFGMAIGDIVLPEGRTVETLMTEMLTKAFREAGYQVVDPTDTRTDVIPVEADIEQFWSWIVPATWSIGVFFETTVNITCDLGTFKAGEKVTGKIQLQSQAVTTRAWTNTMNKGIAAFVEEMRNRLTATKP